MGISRAEGERKRWGIDIEEGSWRGKEKKRRLERKKMGVFEKSRGRLYRKGN